MNKMKLLSSIAIFTIAFSINIEKIESKAEELSIYDQNRMEGASTPDWLSSNIREWLNSNETDVRYTGLEPSYKDEPGFLSRNNFTEEEFNAIAVTRHGGGSLSGGNLNDTQYISNKIHDVKNHYIYNDKVFILNFQAIVDFIEPNNDLLNLNTKYLSNYLQERTNKLDKYEYSVNDGYYNKAYTDLSIVLTSRDVRLSRVKEEQNIVPALSLKPEYTLSNGIKAKNLNVGEKVLFGKYNNEPIEWQVINKSEDGLPLLWSTKIITIKEYDAPGDINPRYSDYIDFKDYDVDITSPEYKLYSWETDNVVLSKPIPTIENEEVLLTPTNEKSITIKIRPTDENYDIRSITLPDGNKVFSDSADFIIRKNGQYSIVVENSVGIITPRHIVTKAINSPAEVLISTDKDESTKWTNKPVNVTIQTSNKYEDYFSTIKGNTQITGSLITNGNFYPDWIPLGGKTVRVKGTFKNLITDEDIANNNIDMNALLKIRLDTVSYDIGKLWKVWPILKEFTLQELKDKGEIVIDEIFTIPNNVYSEIRPYITLMDQDYAYRQDYYKYWISDFSFEILEKDDLEITEITMPNGEIIRDNSATYTINEKGSYTFKAKDTRGQTTFRTIDVDIDMKKPNINIAYDSNTITGDSIKLKISSTDDLSGIKYIKLPNGEYRRNDNDCLPLDTEYNILENGSYTFEVSDFAGNIIKETITISNIDKEKPNLEFSLNPNDWTSSDVIIKISATDNLSGVDYIVVPNGSKVYSETTSYTVSKNGDYSFIARDRVGNSNTIKVKVRNIDTIKPEVEITKNPNIEWSNTDVEVTIKEKDTL